MALGNDERGNEVGALRKVGEERIFEVGDDYDARCLVRVDLNRLENEI